MKKIGLSDCKLEISNVCNALEGNCLEAIKIVCHHANGRFDWLISEHQSVNPSKEAIYILSLKYKRFKFVHPVKLDINTNKTALNKKNMKNLFNLFLKSDEFESKFHCLCQTV